MPALPKLFAEEGKNEENCVKITLMVRLELEQGLFGPGNMGIKFRSVPQTPQNFEKDLGATVVNKDGFAMPILDKPLTSLTQDQTLVLWGVIGTDIPVPDTVLPDLDD